MPIYTYTCKKCGKEQEHLVRYDDRAEPQPCACGGKQHRRGVELPTMKRPDHQMAAIMSDGSRVPGHFAKDAKRKK